MHESVRARAPESDLPSRMQKSVAMNPFSEVNQWENRL